MRPGLALGACHLVRYTVPLHQTVPDLLPDLAEFRRGQPVFATGFMVGLMEAPCMAAVYPYLESGEATVGTLINMNHVAPSPPGTALVAKAHTIAIQGRSVRFAVVVADEAGEVAATGEHGLRVIEVARFHDRLAAKRAQVRRRDGDRERLDRRQPYLPVTDAGGIRSHVQVVQPDKHLITARASRAQTTPTKEAVFDDHFGDRCASL